MSNPVPTWLTQIGLGIQRRLPSLLLHGLLALAETRTHAAA